MNTTIQNTIYYYDNSNQNRLQEGRKLNPKIGYGCMKEENAESAENPQNTQTGWECGDDANYVSYATIPARLFNILKSQADIVSKPEYRASLTHRQGRFPIGRG